MNKITETGTHIVRSANAQHPTAAEVVLRRGVENVCRARAANAEVARRLRRCAILDVIRRTCRRRTRIGNSQVGRDNLLTCRNAA